SWHAAWADARAHSRPTRNRPKRSRPRPRSSGRSRPTRGDRRQDARGPEAGTHERVGAAAAPEARSSGSRHGTLIRKHPLPTRREHPAVFAGPAWGHAARADRGGSPPPRGARHHPRLGGALATPIFPIPAARRADPAVPSPYESVGVTLRQSIKPLARAL